MLTPVGARLEVWGDPIAHSRSPLLHAAAYAALGLDWSYGRRRVDEESFAGELAGLDASFRGLSLTMPLKGVARAASVTLDRPADLTGAVNTLLISDDGPRGFNTDVGGIVQDLREHGIDAPPRARIVGAGATATSAVVALAELGAEQVDVVARRPEAAASLAAFGGRLGMRVSASALDAGAFTQGDVTISTLPGDAPIAGEAAQALAEAGGLLYDVVYGHWPTALALAWERHGNQAVWGLGMLLHQALLQVRVFVHGDPAVPLADEEHVLAAMRASIAVD
ncbi:shikimate dehydrogenase family protein [Microbacterium sp. ASV49]|uniref:Shikimate dehydrogenase n=1 Tax=Microbacterium candidum TaxID=3041922 RepID=A0ABT7MZ86_9MICO|nr:shikimate dehydrogenase [Microbacterium sp. ASV49]MDL9979766.1 shikimate dehydrogenase [Microbacterium sp. ASV49]